MKDFDQIEKENQREKEQFLFARKRVLNKQFKFDAKQLKQLIKLNKYLTVKQNEILEICSKLNKQLAKQVKTKNNWFHDYEIEIYMAFNNEQYEDPIYESKCILHYSKNSKINKDLGYRGNFNDRQETHPLYKQTHCYIFHHLYDHTSLAWQDIININETWFEIVVRYQLIEKL